MADLTPLEEAAARVRAWLDVYDKVWPDGDPRFGGGLSIAYEGTPISADDLRSLLAALPSAEERAATASEMDRLRTKVEELELRHQYDLAYRPEVVAEVAVEVSEECDWDSIAKWVGGDISTSSQYPSGEYESWISIPADRVAEGSYRDAGVGQWITLGHDGLFRVRHAVEAPSPLPSPSEPGDIDQRVWVVLDHQRTKVWDVYTSHAEAVAGAAEVAARYPDHPLPVLTSSVTVALVPPRPSPSPIEPEPSAHPWLDGRPVMIGDRLVAPHPDDGGDLTFTVAGIHYDECTYDGIVAGAPGWCFAAAEEDFELYLAECRRAYLTPLGRSPSEPGPDCPVCGFLGPHDDWCTDVVRADLASDDAEPYDDECSLCDGERTSGVSDAIPCPRCNGTGLGDPQ